VYRATRVITAVLVLLVTLTVSCPGAQSFSASDRVTIAPDGHVVLVNFTVDQIFPADDAGSMRYLITLDDSSAQDRYDVLLLKADEYQKYASGLPFDYELNASFIDAGAIPATNYVYFDSTGDYVLLLDNSDRTGVPSVGAELVINYEVFLDNVEVQKKPQWDLFILLMVIVVLIGVAFLLLLRTSMRSKLERAGVYVENKCAHCGGNMNSSEELCPHCGQRR
jgi:hypothetical protein